MDQVCIKTDPGSQMTLSTSNALYGALFVGLSKMRPKKVFLKMTGSPKGLSDPGG